MKLRLGTYNIHRAIGVDRRFRLDRVAEVLEVHDPDVVLLQEVDDGAPRSQKLDLAKELAGLLQYPHYEVGHNVRLRRGRYGNSTLSRFPILKTRNVDLSIGRLKSRGCLHTTLDLAGTEDGPVLEVFNLHLGLSARERQQQAGLLASAPEFAQLTKSKPCIVGGDFNDWRSLLRPFFVEALEFRCATDRDVRNGARGIKTYPSFSPRGALDRVYFRGPLQLIHAFRCNHKKAKVASDHLPIFVEFEVG